MFISDILTTIGKFYLLSVVTTMFFNKNLEHIHKIKATNAFLISMMKKSNIPVVSYTLINNHHITHHDTISITPSIQLSNPAILQACSLSKALTAFAVVKLAQQNKVMLDTPINEQLSSWKLSNNICNSYPTPRECLAMTSGIHYSKLDPAFPGYLQNQKIPSLKNILHGIPPASNGAVEIAFLPKSKYLYSGAGYMVLQQLIEDITQMPFQIYMIENILNPLNMKYSTFECPLPANLTSYAIPGFNSENQVNPQGWYNNASLAAGGLWATPVDLAYFMLNLTKAYLGDDNSIISQTFAKEILTRQIDTIFGLGVVIDNDGDNFNFKKNGFNTGYTNQFIMFSNTGQGIVVMTNSAKGMNVINELISFVAHEYNWPSYSANFDELNMNDFSV